MLPTVTILMAIYKPNIQWLEEQLISLNKQTYSNLKLLVWNDCPDDKTDYNEFFSKCINKYPYALYKGEKNMGSNKAFEKLTELADSDYVAYCDQDDVWLPQKIEVLVDSAVKENAGLICSDMQIIDGNGKLVAHSITTVRPHHVFVNTDKKFESLCSRNFIVGCTTLVKTELAKKAVPFPDEFVHDWWIGLNIAIKDKISIINKPLIQYRIHGNNQTGVMMGVKDHLSYCEKRIKPVVKRSEILLTRLSNTNKLDYLKRFNDYALCRERYFYKHSFSNFFRLLKYMSINPSTVLFELFMPVIPMSIFSLIINKIRQGKL